MKTMKLKLDKIVKENVLTVEELKNTCQEIADLEFEYPLRFL